MLEFRLGHRAIAVEQRGDTAIDARRVSLRDVPGHGALRGVSCRHQVIEQPETLLQLRESRRRAKARFSPSQVLAGGQELARLGHAGCCLRLRMRLHPQTSTISTSTMPAAKAIRLRFGL